MKAIQTGMFAVLSAASLLAAAQPETSLNLPGPGVQQMLLGNWSTKIQYEASKEMPRGGTASGDEKWYPGPGGRSLIEEYREDGVAGDITGWGVIWWDAQAKGYHVVWCESTNPNGCAAPSGLAHWEGEQLVLVSEDGANGGKAKFKEVFSQITSSSFKQTIYLGDASGELRLLATIYATRTTAH